MVGNIIEPYGGNGGSTFDPDSMFDENNTATEENFIQLVEHGVYDSKYIGYKVQLSNSVDYNNGLYVIADVNHDSTNTGQSNCYDLISQDCINPGSSFGSDQYWRNSTVRTWLNNTYYNGFGNDFKSHIMNIKYNSNVIWYDDDKIIIPSFIEINGTTGTSETRYITEGMVYPIFTDNNSRVKNYNGSTCYWWTRSRDTSYSNNVWGVYNRGSLKGSLGLYYYGNSYYLAPLLRVQ